MYGPASISGTSTHRERPNVREGGREKRGVERRKKGGRKGENERNRDRSRAVSI